MTKFKPNNIYNLDCITGMKEMKNDSVDFTLTDIPYGEVNRKTNRLRNLDKEEADVLTFDLEDFLEEVYRVTKNSICIFCGRNQFSQINNFFAAKKGTVRTVVYQKKNPSPMNGKIVYLSGVELAIWFKKSGAKTFNAFCKNTVFKYPIGKRDIHPTQKNPDLFRELIIDNTNKGDLVFDPCIGSGTTAIVCMEMKRNYLGFELKEEYFKAAQKRIEDFGASI